MSKENNRKIYALSDDFISQLQKLVSLCALTGTNVVDHVRQLRLEEKTDKPGMLMLTPEYVEYHNNVITKLSDEADKLIAEQTKTLFVGDTETN